MSCGCGRKSSTPKPQANQKYQYGENPLKRNTTWGKTTTPRKRVNEARPKGR